MTQRHARGPFLFVGNHPCLDFINTEMVVRGEPIDLLVGFRELVAWLVQAGLLMNGREERSMLQWGRAERDRVLTEAIAFRQALRDMAGRIVGHKPVASSSVDAINRLLAQRPGYPQVVHTKGGYERRFYTPSTPSAGVLTPLAEAAGDLLCHGDWSLVKKCGNPACVLYFYDTTKNHARTWCSMQLCGNRMKVAAHYQRKRLTRG